MAASRTQGPILTASIVEDGTLVRTASPAPGIRGQHNATDNIADWSLKQKLTVALRRTVPKLPEGMRNEFQALLSPENLAITVGVIAVWVASHAFGVGEIVDAVMVVVGAVTLGMSIFSVVNDIRKFAVLAGSATTQRDLDQAATHLATAISVVGVAVFAAIIAKGATKIKAKPMQVPVKRLPVAEVPAKPPSQRAYQTLTPLDAEMHGDGPMAQAMRRAALDEFYKMHPGLEYKGMVYDGKTRKWVRSRPEQRRASHIAGTNLTRPVIRRMLQPGEEIIMYQRAGGQPGTYLARAGTSASQLGISPAGRIVKRYKVTEALEVMESTAADMASGAASGVGGKGGGQQLIMPPDWERKVRPF